MASDEGQGSPQGGQVPPSGGKVRWVDLSAFGEPAGAPTGMRANLPIMGLGFVAAMVAFALLIFLWYLSSEAMPWTEAYGGPVVLLIVLLAAIFLVYRTIRQRIRWESGVGRLLSEQDFRRADLGKPLPWAGTTPRDLVRRLRAIAASYGTAVQVRSTDPATIKRAQITRYVAIGITIAGAIVFMFTMTVGIGVLFAGAAVFVLAARIDQPSLQEVRAQDPRRPILLLRSFRDDRLMAPQRFRYLFWFYVAARRFEQSIAGSFGEFGPLIAVGEPGEKRPQLGAARAYLPGDKWQEAVLGWIEESLLIVMVAGTTQWVTWELHRILEKQRFRHLFILVPPEPPVLMRRGRHAVATRAERWGNVVKSFADTPWHDGLSSIDVTKVLLVQLDPGGQVTAVKSSNTFVQDYLLAIGLAINDEFGDRAG